MQSGRVSRLAGLFVAVTVLSLGCRPSPEATGRQPTAPDSIVCSVFYRPSPGVSFQEAGLTVTENSPQERVEFDGVSFNAQFVVDQGEGRSLSISVTRSDTGDEMVRQLYQIDPATGLANQFIGGHGFTGLNYVYPPDSTGEMQYFCEAG